MNNAATTPAHTSPLIAVEIVWSESALIEDGARFETLAKAEAAIAIARDHAPKGGAYDKTKFVIRLRNPFADGDPELTYEGRLDLIHTSEGPQTLVSHVHDFASYIQQSPYYDEQKRLQAAVVAVTLDSVRAAEVVTALVSGAVTLEQVYG